MGIGAENINPYHNDSRDKGLQVREMFDNIAPAYDFMNRAMTLGIDRCWRRKAVGIIKKHLSKKSVECPKILDVATGTADLAIYLAKAIKGCMVTGVDLSANMIEIGKQKVGDKGLQEAISLLLADCLELPFPDNSFDCVTVAYGVRNFSKLSQGYTEMLRVMRPGGILCVIELSTPTSPIVRPLYNFYTRTLIPAIGRIISHDSRAYAYLPESIAAVAQGAQMTALIRDTGFIDANFLPLTFGTCTIYTAFKKY